MEPPKLRTILLFPPHVSPNPTTLPLLTALQSLLNVSYTARYCTRPDIFGISHLRLVDPATFADIIGADGFTIIILAVTSEGSQSRAETSDHDKGNAARKSKVMEIVATCSVKAVDDEYIRKHPQWVPHAAQEKKGRNNADSNSISAASKELDEKLQALYHQRQNPPRVHELCAFAVSPAHQGLGLGASILRTVEWLLGSDSVGVLDVARGMDMPFTLGEFLLSSVQIEKGAKVYGVDLDEVKNVFGQGRNADVTASEGKILEQDAANGVETSLSQCGHRRLVLFAIRELGNEGYYQRRGYRSISIGTLPLGTWGSFAECTMVCMEKSI